jgi:hypothetical protein
MELIVPDDKLSLAIGKKGQNVRLASQLTGWRIDIPSRGRGGHRSLRACKSGLGMPSEPRKSEGSGARQFLEGPIGRPVEVEHGQGDRHRRRARSQGSRRGRGRVRPGEAAVQRPSPKPKAAADAGDDCRGDRAFGHQQTKVQSTEGEPSGEEPR